MMMGRSSSSNARRASSGDVVAAVIWLHSRLARVRAWRSAPDPCPLRHYSNPVAREQGAATPTSQYDAIIIGGGHNGLTSAAYLARAGMRTLVLERRHVLGGAAVTEEIVPGFRFSVASYVVSLLRPEVIRDLELPKFGLDILPLDGTFT